MVASPDYLAQHGTPRSVDDLHSHRFVIYGGEYGANDRWSYCAGAEIKSFALDACIRVNDGYALLKAALDGAGIAMAARFGTLAELEAGQLTQVLPTIELTPFSPIYLVYPSRSYLPKKTRLFVDRMREYIGDPPFWLR